MDISKLFNEIMKDINSHKFRTTHPDLKFELVESSDLWKHSVCITNKTSCYFIDEEDFVFDYTKVTKFKQLSKEPIVKIINDFYGSKPAQIHFSHKTSVKECDGTNVQVYVFDIDIGYQVYIKAEYIKYFDTKSDKFYPVPIIDCKNNIEKDYRHKLRPVMITDACGKLNGIVVPYDIKMK